MARKRRNPVHLDDLPGLFDSFEIDMTRPDMAGDLIARHRAQAATLDDDREADDAAADFLLAPTTVSPTDRLMFISFGSGSSGNCAYLGNGKEGILIDAGVDPDTVKAGMRDNGIDFKGVRGILITHDHSDHVRFAYKLLRKQNHMLMYATPRTLSGMLRRHSISSRIKDYHKPIYKEHPFDIGEMRITPFETSHDGTDNVGFHIAYGSYHTFVVMTDTGHITERGDFYIRQAHYLMIESNYDARMLADGEYPEYLKARIASDHGHMDNAHTASYLASVAPEGISHVFLCHLSHDNNTPELALSAARKALETVGLTVGDASGSLDTRHADVQLTALPRFDTSPLYVFREPKQV